MEVVVKAYLQDTDANVEVRRIPVSTIGQDNNKGIFKETFAKVGNAFPGLVEKIFSLKWKDSDGDLVMMTSDEEMLEAIAHSPNAPLKVFISVEGVKEAGFEILDDVPADASQEPNVGGDKESDHQQPNVGCDKASDHQKQHTYPPFYTPPEFDFGDPMSFFGMSGMRKRGNPDSHNPRGSFGNLGPRGHHFDHLGPRGHHFGHLGPRGHHFGHLGPQGCQFDNMGPRGHHFGHLGPRSCHFEQLGPRGHHFGHMGPRGHHFGHMDPRGNLFDNMGPRGHHFGHLGPRGHHFGHFGLHGNPCHQFGNFMGMNCQFEGQDFGEEQNPCQEDAEMFFSHHFGHHHGGHHHHEENGWKAKLRDAVPVAHRRWAKFYIRSWRVQNLKNATSTSSDTDQEIFTMEAASVPEAYAAWLDIILVKWHKRLGQETSANDDKEKNSEEKRKLKVSVPMEFRKWAKWYLARHFGKKDAPKFRKGHHSEGKMDKLRKKDWKKAFKMETLAVTIPSEYRLWAKTFIRDWRQEQNVPDPRPEESVFSESDDTEKRAVEGGLTVPPDYAKWMRMFLARWHLWRGQIDGQKVNAEDGNKGEFKKTVPKAFRKWVKCYLWRRYGKGTQKEEEGNTVCQYQKWLQAFQKKWLLEQSKEGNGDVPVMTSSDEDTATLTDQEMESSFKKLRLGQDKARMVPDSDDEVNSGFHNWFKHALWQWDGRTAPEVAQEEAVDIQQVPPYLYNWMYKKMMKMQRKRMKHQFKQAKHSMKAAMKGHRHGYY